MADLAVYPSALTGTDVATLWGAGAAGLPADDCPVASGPYADVVMADEPTSYYRAGERVADPTARVAADSSGHCRHGSFEPGAAGATSALTGSDGAADRLAGDWVIGATAAGLPTGTAGAFSIEAWSKRTTTAWRDVLHAGSMGLATVNNSRLYVWADGGFEFNIPMNVGDGAWHHYAMSFDGTRVRVYVDAALVTTWDRVVTAPREAVLGGSSGATDELATYDRALSTADVARHWATGRSTVALNPCPEATDRYGSVVVADGATAYYRLGEAAIDGAAQVAIDSSGGCRHGSVEDSTTGTTGAIAGSTDGAVTSSVGGMWEVRSTVTGLIPTSAEGQSVEVWANIESGSAWRSLLTAQGAFELSSVNDGTAWARVEGVWSGYFSAPGHRDGGWHQWVVTNDGTETRIYLDGTVVAVVGGDMNIPAGQLLAGEAMGIDELSVYPTALGPDDVARHWGAGAADLADDCPVADDRYGAEVVADDALAFYRLGERTADPSARVAVDSSGSCRHGQLRGDLTATDGATTIAGDGAVHAGALYGMSATFDGLPDASPTELSAEVWTRTTENSFRRILSVPGAFELAMSNGTQAWIRLPGTDDRNIALLVPINDGEWHQWVVTDDGSRTRVFLDSVEVWSLGWDARTPTGEVYLGEQIDVDEVSLYPSALGPDAIARHWAAGRSALTGEDCPVADGAYGSAVVADDPVAYYRLGERSRDAEARVAVDSSGSCRHGAIQPDTTGTTGAIPGSTDGAIARTGDGRSVGASVDGLIDPEADGLSVEVWFRSTSTAHTRFIWLADVVELASWGEGLWLRQAGLDDRATTLPIGHLDGEWHHFVITNDGTTTWVYQDGQQLWATSTDWPVPTGFLYAGGDGAVDELALYDRPLTPAEVDEHYDTRSVPDPREAAVDLVAPDEVGYSAPFEVEVDLTPVLPATATPTGMVVVEVDGEPVGEAALVAGSATVTVDEPIEPGPHELTVIYGGNASYDEATSEAADLTVVASATIADVTAEPSPSAVGDEVDVTVELAPVAPATEPPTGEVRLYDGLRPVGTADALDGVATFTVGDLAVGTHTLRASLTANDRWRASTTSTRHDVRVATTVTLAVGPPTVWGQAASATAVVRSTDSAGPIPTGLVRIVDEDDETVADGTIDGSGRVDLLLYDLPVGSTGLRAVYDGDARHLTSTSDEATATVDRSRAHVSLDATPDPAATDADVTLSAQVVAVGPGRGTPTGFVTFSIEGEPSPLGTAVVGATGAAAITVTFPTEGSRRLVATYGGDTEHTSATSMVRRHRVEPTTVLELVADPDEVTYGDAVELTATVTATGTTPVGTVTFSADGVELGTAPVDGNGDAVLATDRLGHGEVEVTARYAGPAFAPSSGSATVSVAPLDAEVELVVGTGESTYGTTVEAEVTVSAPGVPTDEVTGSVAVTVDDEPAGEADLVDGTAAISLDALDVGDHEVTAIYAGRADGDLDAATDTVDHVVVEAPVTVTLAAPTGPVAAGGDVELEAAVVRPVGPARAPPTGEVTFLVDGTDELDTADLDDGTAVVTTDELDVVGTYSITAVYSGDDSHLPEESSAETWTVLAEAEVVVTAPAAATDLGQPATFAVVIDPGATPTVPTGEVTLVRGDEVLATADLDVVGAASLVTADLRGGSTDLVVTYTGDLSFAAAESAVVTHDVERSPVTTDLHARPTPVAEGAPVNVVAHVEGDAPNSRPTGTVRFWLPDGATRDATLDGDGRAFVRLAGLESGEYEVQALYFGDDSHDLGEVEAVEVDVVDALDFGVSVTPSSGIAGLVVSAEIDGDVGEADVSWAFGDGESATGLTATHTYTQPGLYTVVATADDGVTEHTATARVEVGADVPLTARAGVDQVVAHGEPVLFDGTGSRPSPGIDSWLWELGDGSTSSNPTTSHTYAEPGTYVARLTVTSAGQSISDEVTIEVTEVAPDEGLHVTVLGADGPLEGADVLVVDPGQTDFRGATDADGVAVLAGLANATYSVYAIAPGHRPKMVKATVSEGYGEAVVTLDAGERGITSVTSRQLTGAEAAAAGVDTEAPGNNRIFALELWLEFEKEVPGQDEEGNARGPLLVNGDGEFVGPWNCPPHECEFDTTDSHVRVTAIDGGDGDRPTLVWMVMPAAAKWMREMFEVEMVVQNLADPDFAFEDGAARLDLPPGLSLATMTTPQESVVEVDDIVGGTSGKARWIVRGDEPGTFTPRASYTGWIYPFGAPVGFDGVSARPVTVVGAEALELAATVDDTAYQYSPYQAQVAITNTASIPVYNVAIELFDQGTLGFVYQPSQRNLQMTDELAPGATFVAEAVLVPWAFSGIEDPVAGAGDIDLEDSFVRGLGGTDTLPVTLTSQQATPRAGRPTMCAAGFHLDEDGVCSDTSTADEEEWKERSQPFGEVALTWDGSAPGPYRLYRSNSPFEPFAAQPVWEGDATSYRKELTPGEWGFYAVTAPGPDGREEMVHNAVLTQAGYRSTANLDLGVACIGGEITLEIEYEDPWFPMEQFRVVTGLDEETWEPGAGQYLTGGPLSGMEGVEYWDVPSSIFFPGDHVTEVTASDGQQIPAATVYVQVKNTHDPVWGEPVPVVVFDGCEHDMLPIPADQTFGYGCTTEEYLGHVGVKGANRSRCRQDPVNTATGSLLVRAGDLSLPAPGIAFEMVRTYNSADDWVGPLGRGWTHAFGQTLTFPEEDIVVHRDDDGQRVAYVEVEAPPGTGRWFQSNTSPITIKRTPAPEECDCRYILERPDGTISFFDDDGHLVRVHDRSGNGLDLINDTSGRPLTAVDDAGRTITFGYTGDRLTSVTLPDGRSVTYGYTDGLLTSVVDPRLGTTTYRYEGELLVEETNPEQHRVHLTDYVDGRVVTQEDGLGALTTWSWDPETETSTMTDAVGGVHVDRYEDNLLQSATDPLGRTTSYLYDAQANVVQMTDPAGGVSSFDHDDLGRVTRQTGPGPLHLTERFSYDEWSNVTSHVLPDGAVVSYDYDTSGRPEAMAGPGAAAASIEHDAAGLPDWTEDAAGNRAELTHDAAGNLVEECSQLVVCTTRGYDASGRLKWVVGPAGNVAGADPDDHRVSFGYDADDNRTSETDPLGRETTYTYDANGNVTVIEHPDGMTITRTYDDADQMITESVEGAPPTVNEWDDRGLLLKTTSPEGRTTRWAYDLAGQVRSKTDGEGRTWRYGYDALGLQVSTSDPSGRTARREYDAAGRVVRTVDALGGVTETEYDRRGNVVRSTDPTGATARSAYDSTGRVTSTTDAAGGTTSYEYDEASNLVAVVDPAGGRSEATYDPDGRVTAVTGPLGFVAGASEEDHTTHYVYGDNGQVETVVDPLDRETAYVYDAMARVVEETGPDGRTTAYGYDEMGRQASITTPDDETTSWEYDTAGDLVRREQPDGNATTYTHDDDHLQLTETDPLDRTWRVAYDSAGQVEHTWDAIATAAGPSVPPTTTTTYDRRGLVRGLDHADPATPDVSYTYDALGRTETMTDGVGVMRFRYDAAGRVRSTTRGSERFAYDYDGAGRLRSTTYPDGTVVDQVVDQAGRLREVEAFGAVTRYDYDVAGQLDEVRFPNGATETIAHDALGRFSSSTVAVGETAITASSRTYELSGQVASETSPAGTVTFGHDDRGRLDEMCTATCTPEAPTVGYGYDDAGNRIVETDSGVATRQAAHDAADQLTEYGHPSSAVTGVTYDGNGNVVDDGLRSYRYDAAGRLVQVSVSDPAESASTVAGTVTDPADAPIEGIAVRAYAFGREVASALTAADGSYELTGLPATAYDVYFDALGDGEHVSAWNGGATEPASSVPVEVAPREQRTLDQQLDDVALSTLIYGQVTDEDGDPIADAQVTLGSVTVDWLRQHPAPYRHPVPVEMGLGSLTIEPRVDGEWTGGAVLPVEAGADVDIDVLVTNTGLRDLADVEVVFPEVPLTCPGGADDVIDAIAVGQTVICSATTTALAGRHDGSATATTGDDEVISEHAGYIGHGACTVTGTSGADTLTGTSGADVICGLGGDDEIDGLGGADVLLGGAGTDTLLGGSGEDVLDDGPGADADVLDGGDDDDLVHAAGGDDTILASAGHDRSFGGAGDDTMTAGDDGSVMLGGTGANTMIGGDGYDQLHSAGSGGSLTGGLGGDWLFSQADTLLDGGDGPDLLLLHAGDGADLLGGADEDIILSGTGEDALDGGEGADLLMGGAGVDTFPNREAGVDLVHQDTFEATVATDDEGRWSARVPAGIYRLQTGAAGYLGEVFDDTRWYPASGVAVLRELSAGEVDVTLAPDPGWEPPVEAEAPASLGDPGEVLARHVYDGLGNRVATATEEGTTRSTYDMMGGLARLATETGPDGHRSVAWGLGPVAVADGGEDPVFLHTDAIGSVTAVTDASGAVVGRAGYAPFGELRWSDGAMVDGTIGGVPFGFAGERYDAVTGLYDLRARWYDPAWGRFTQPDPAGPMPGAGHESTYLYAAGSPLDTVDPTGLRIEKAERVAADNERRFAEARPKPDMIQAFWDHGWEDMSFSQRRDFVIGMIPGIGDLYDIYNGVRAAMRGDWGEALIYGLSALPALGNAMAGGLRAFRYSDEALDASRAFRYGDEIAEMGSGATSARRGLDFPTTRSAGGGNDFIDLYHGTTVSSAANIRRNGIDLARSRRKLDFGPGFYTTENLSQATRWAQRSARRTGSASEVLHFRVPRSELTGLRGRAFTSGSSEWDSFVRANRAGGLAHGFDVVEGPMARQLKGLEDGSSLNPGGHQLSVHTPAGASLLDRFLA